MPYLMADDGVGLYYQTHGSGKPLILLHGWSLSGRVFERNISELAEKYQVVSLDQRGHGHSGREPINLTMTQLARDVAALIDHLHLESVVLAGWSMGMVVIYNYLQDFGSGQVTGLVNLDMTPKLLKSEGWPHAAFGTLEAAGCLDIFRQIGSERQQFTETLFVPAMFAAGSPPPSDEADFWAAESRILPDHHAIALWTSFACQDWRSILPEITVPVLLLHGAQSQAYPTPVWEYLAANLKESSTSIIDGAGHALFWEQPSAVNASLIEFVDSL